jgi:hypothetical protein
MVVVGPHGDPVEFSAARPDLNPGGEEPRANETPARGIPGLLSWRLVPWMSLQRRSAAEPLFKSHRLPLFLIQYALEKPLRGVDHAEARFWSLQIPVAVGHARRSTSIPSIAVEPGSSSTYNAKVSDAAMRDAFMWWENRTDSRGAWNWRTLPLSLGAVRCPAGEDGR